MVMLFKIIFRGKSLVPSLLKKLKEDGNVNANIMGESRDSMQK